MNYIKAITFLNIYLELVYGGKSPHQLQQHHLEIHVSFPLTTGEAAVALRDRDLSQRPVEAGFPVVFLPGWQRAHRVTFHSPTSVGWQSVESPDACKHDGIGTTTLFSPFLFPWQCLYQKETDSSERPCGQFAGPFITESGALISMALHSFFSKALYKEEIFNHCI